MRRYLLVQEKFVQFRQSALNAGLCPAEILGQFFVILPSISSKTCVICSLLFLGTYVFRNWPFLGCSYCVSLATAANFRFFLNVAIF